MTPTMITNTAIFANRRTGVDLNAAAHVLPCLPESPSYKDSVVMELIAQIVASGVNKGTSR